MILKNKLEQSLLFILLIVSINGCDEVSQHEPREVKTLYFKGLPTDGIDYQCGERQGVTKPQTYNALTLHGTITCVYSPIKFYLGKLYLGEVKDIAHNQRIYPQTLIPSFNGDFNNPELLKLSILLQSLNSERQKSHISITQTTKDKITLSDLKHLNISELKQEIRRMGFNPISIQEAKINLILHSENTNSGKPKIQPFEEDISSNIMVGSTIGQLSIDSGDGTLHHPFILKGEGSEKFLLNNNGKLILTQSLEREESYNLTVTATNEYGYTTQTIKIHVIDGNKIGKAQMGRLKGATVELFKLNRDGSRVLVGTTTTKTTGVINQIGNFDLMTNLMDDHEFYLYEVTGGTDVDVDNDGIIDSNGTQNHGVLHLLTKGIWIKNSMQKIRITPLSEILYTYIKKFDYTSLEKQLNHHAKLLLKSSLNHDQTIESIDIMIFDPLNNQNLLSDTLTYNQTYQTITNKIRRDNPSYQSDIFSAYVVDSFQSNAIEIVGSTIYTVDMLQSGEFRIYDLESKQLIGKLKLPNTPIEEDSHVIYINLEVNQVRISSLTEYSYNLDIKNHRKPLLEEKPFIENVIFFGEFNHISIGKSQTNNIFSKERNLYFYNKKRSEDGGGEKISFFKITLDTPIYQYSFDSNLSTIQSIWEDRGHLYVVGDNKIHIFKEKHQKMQFLSNYTTKSIEGDILGIEEKILYILNNKTLTLLDISEPSKPLLIEEISVPFNYKLGIRTNGKYITTGSKIIDIQALKASKNAKTVPYK